MLNRRFTSAKQLDGVVDLDRLDSGRPTDFERNAAAFFDCTFPSEEVHSVIGRLSQRFATGTGEGLILAESVKGLGKSHLLLLGYHLFASPAEASQWAAGIGYTWAPPANPIVLVHKFTDGSLPDDALWRLVGQRLGASWEAERPPSRSQVRSALTDRYLVLILDELERGIDSIEDSARRNQNLSFLQLLTEEAAQNPRLTVFAAIYDGNREPGSTLKRVPRVELRFRKPEDRAAIVRHRLFSNAASYDKDAARVLLRSFVNAWRQFGIETSDAYLARMEASFPFLPDLMDLVFERISASGGFQGTRGALGLIGAMVDAAAEGTSLFTAGHCRLNDTACANRLQDLDPSAHLINCAAANLRDLGQQPHAEAIASAVLMASLAPGGRASGLTKEELIRHVIKPGDDPNAFHAGLDAFARFGTYFHEREGRYFFDHEENEHAKVELEAAKGNDEEARALIMQVWQQDLFKDTRQSLVYTDAEATIQRLAALPTQSQRFVLSARRLSQLERHALYQGQQLRNQILLLEPRDARVNHLANPDLLALARRLRAAKMLSETAQNSERRSRFERIQREQLGQIQRLLKSAGLVYVRVEEWTETPEQTRFEEENLGPASSREEVLNYLRAQIFPVSYVQEHVRAHLNDFIGRNVAQIDRVYRNTLGFPVPLSTTAVTEAITRIVEDGARLAGLQHRRGNFCGERVSLSEPELNESVLARQWPPESRPAPTPQIPGQPTPASPIPSDEEPLPPAPPINAPMVQEWATTSCRSIGELRQALAQRLDEQPGTVVRGVRFSIYASHRGQELSALPSALRGALSGTADLEVQLDLRLQGPLTKAELEDRCERLPSLSGASYTARVQAEAPAEAGSAEL